MTTGSFFTRVKSRVQRAPKSPLQSKPQSKPQPQDPVLDNDDEVFLNRVLSETPPTAVDVPTNTDANNNDDDDGDEQAEVMATAQKTPLPPTPQGESESERPERSGSGSGSGPRSRSMQDGSKAGDTARKSDSKWKAKRLWDSVKKNRAEKNKDTDKSRKSSEAADASPSGTTTGKEKEKEEEKETDAAEQDAENEDMAQVLDKLNLAATDNRVFSISDEMQSLLKKFKVILKDLLNGVPTAYNDLESLFTHSDKQLQELFDSLPKFLQKLVTHLPDKLAPEMLATAAAKAESGAQNVKTAGEAAGGAAAASAAPKVSFKELVTKPAAVTGFLRSIVAFLRARFPALLGANVLWSLAISLLLLVLWYCHKRGREVRLEKERSEQEEESAQVDDEDSQGDGDGAGAGDEKSSPEKDPASGKSPVAEASPAEDDQQPQQQQPGEGQSGQATTDDGAARKTESGVRQ